MSANESDSISFEGQTNRLSYRPDIDGLRAIAVIAVCLFHAHLKMTGGFVGVDIFFVISGFLIASLILKDAESANGFSILKFWDRRIRRIMPALLLVVLTTLVVGWFVLLPIHFKELGESVLAQAVFSSNIFFWHTSGYFDETASQNPLLHTWSLAVEEQFYLFFPLLFLLQTKWKISSLRWVIGLSAIVSLALSETLTKCAPDAAFYLLPSRAWELFGGGFLALLPKDLGLNIPLWVREILAWGGLLAIALAVWFYDGNTSFPGLRAALPCVGTMAIIWINRLSGQPLKLARILSFSPLVFVGRISYSLYLWHWPVLVYAAYWQDDGILRWYSKMGLLLLSFALATFSWKFIETPFRTRRVLPLDRQILTFGLVSCACCTFLGALVVLDQGSPSRFPKAVLEFFVPGGDVDVKRLNSNLASALRGDFPQAGKADAPIECLVWGDSHAMALYPAFNKLALDSSTRVIYATHTAQCPVLDYGGAGRFSLEGQSKAWCEAVVETVRREHIPKVVIVACWQWYGEKDTLGRNGISSRREFAEKLANTVTELQRAGAKVWILKDVPKQPMHVRMGVIKAILNNRSLEIGVSKEEYLESSRAENEMLGAAVSKGALILDPYPFFFANRETSLIESSGSLLYNDDSHLTPRGALLLSDLFHNVVTE